MSFSPGPGNTSSGGGSIAIAWLLSAGVMIIAPRPCGFSCLGGSHLLWHGPFMPSTLQPSELRPLLHEKLDQWASDDLPLLHRVMVQLERDRLIDELNVEFDRDREAGRLTRLPEIIREARAALATRRTEPA